MPVISSIDPTTRRVFLAADTVGVDLEPMDIYREMRTLRRTNETLRQYDLFLEAFGNEDIGGGSFTPRFVRLLQGTRIVPFDTDHELTVVGSLITDDGQSGTACFDRSPLSVSTVVDINYRPPQVEVIQVNTGSGVTPGDVTDISVAVWNYVTRTLTSGGGGGGGATAQEIWEYSTRELTSAPSLDANEIRDAVWNASLASYNIVGSAGEALGDITVDNNAIAVAVWNNGTRDLTEPAGVTAQDISDITQSVWSNGTRSLTTSFPSALDVASEVWTAPSRTITDNSLDPADITAIADAVWQRSQRSLTVSPVDAGDVNDIVTAVWANATRTLTTQTSINQADIDAITAQVWTQATRELTTQTGLTASQDAILQSLPSAADVENEVLNTVAP